MNFPVDHQTRRQIERAERRVKNKISSFVWGLVLLPIFLCLFAGVFGGIIWYVMEEKAEIDEAHASGATPAAGPATPGLWDGASTFECRGNDHVSLTGQTATLAVGPAFRTSGNCQLTLTNMNVTAPVVVEAGGNSRVTIVGGTLAGTEKSIAASANARVNVTGATVTGPVDRGGLAQVTGVP